MIFDNKDWIKIDLKNYAKSLKKETDKDNVILNLINYSQLNLETKSNKLKGIPFAIKSNIAIQNTPLNSATNILRNFSPKYTATIIKKLLNNGAIPIVATNLDSLGMGGTGLSSSFGEVKHPFIKNSIIGGSSSGSAYLVATKQIPFSLGTDTGDSIRRPAAYAGIVGYKPTWGLVSRYGVHDFAPTWDSVGWFTNTVLQSALLLEILQEKDINDFSSIDIKKNEYTKNIKIENNKNIKIGIIKPIIEQVNDQIIKDEYWKIIKRLEKKNFSIKDIKIDYSLLEKISIIYKTITSIESFSVNSPLTGFLYGNNFGSKGDFNERITEARTSGFVYEIKKRWLIGMYSTTENNNIYKKINKIRGMLIMELENIFKEVDVLVMPAHSYSKISIDKINEFLNSSNKKNNIIDDYLTLFNANGSPSITIPISNDKKKPIAINISGKPFDDLKVLQIAKLLEEESKNE